MGIKYIVLVILFLMVTQVRGIAAEQTPFEQRLEHTLQLNLPRMGCNLAPRTPKPVDRMVNGEWKKVELIPAPGSIVASPSLRDPDYYFHWIRDSSLVVDTLVRLLPKWEGLPQGQKLKRFIADFLYLSLQLQASPTPYGLGEVRFNVDGSVDDIFWSRPQLDGPALRALTLMRYLRSQKLDPSLTKVAKEIILRDINFVAAAYNQKSFDLWEYSLGYHFYTRMVQLGALEQARLFFPVESTPAWSAAITTLHSQLNTHWDSRRGFYHFSMGPVRDGAGNEVGEVGQGLDASVVFGVTHSGLRTGELSLLDSKLWQSAWKMEEYFRRAYPLNAAHAFGPAMGRHEGDNYYGGNAWFFLTAGYAEFYYQLAREVRGNARPRTSFVVDQYNRAPLEQAMGETLVLGSDLMREPDIRARLQKRLVEKGDAFMATMMDSVGADGMMAEQFSKVDGSPISAADLTWSYAAFLSAALVREEAQATNVDYRGFSLDCRVD